MSDILLTKSVTTLRAFNNEFKHLMPNEYATVFYIKRDENIIPFKSFAFLNGQERMKVHVLLSDGRRGRIEVYSTDQVYFTTNVLYLSDFITNTASFTGLEHPNRVFTYTPILSS